jgi:hypothetical protein
MRRREPTVPPALGTKVLSVNPSNFAKGPSSQEGLVAVFAHEN